MKIATIICNHNYGRYLSDAINSAIQQSYNNDVYVIDDASTDNSIEIINSFSNKINSVLIPNSHGPVGPSEARNIVLNSIIDKYDAFAILDADDMMYYWKIEDCIKVLFEENAVGCVYADYDILNMDTGLILREYKEPFDRFRLGQECIVHSGAVIKSEALTRTKNSNGFYNKTMRTCEDYELWVRISKFFMIAHIPQTMTLVRNHNQNSTSTVPKEVWESNWRKVAAAYAVK